MASTVRRSLSSEPFEVITGSNKSFFVHGDILAIQSEPLRSATTGMWKEATGRKIDLSDWDGETVGRFIEFLYFGNYEVPGSILGELGAEEPKIGGGGLLLAHAKVYALAQYKAVEGLKTMALERLRTALDEVDRRIFRIASMATTTATANIIELMGYVYSHTDSLTTSEEPMRKLVSTFAAKNLEKLVERPEMALLLREKGDLAVELMERMVERTRDERKKLSNAEKQIENWKHQAATSDISRLAEVANTKKIQQTLDVKVRLLEATNTRKILELETTHMETVQKWKDKVERLKGQIKAYNYPFA